MTNKHILDAIDKLQHELREEMKKIKTSCSEIFEKTEEKVKDLKNKITREEHTKAGERKKQKNINSWHRRRRDNYL